MCEHKNVVMTEKSYYRNIKNGYIAEVESDDTDFGKYFIKGDLVSVVCEDCGDELDVY